MRLLMQGHFSMAACGFYYSKMIVIVFLSHTLTHSHSHTRTQQLLKTHLLKKDRTDCEFCIHETEWVMKLLKQSS